MESFSAARWRCSKRLSFMVSIVLFRQCDSPYQVQLSRSPQGLTACVWTSCSLIASDVTSTLRLYLLCQTDSRVTRAIVLSSRNSTVSNHGASTGLRQDLLECAQFKPSCCLRVLMSGQQTIECTFRSCAYLRFTFESNDGPR
jgi:hypothetical protein